MDLYACVPTLRRISLLKVVTLLWNEETVHKQLSDVNKNPQWDEIKKRISDNVNMLEIPSSYDNQIAALLETISCEVISWWKYHIAAEDCPLKMPHQFIWTPEGIIDLRKTTETLVRREDIDIVHRYFWACYYSLESEIPILWNNIDKTDSKELANQLAFDFFVSFWTFKMDPNLSWLSPETRNEFEHYFLDGNDDFSVLFYFCFAEVNRVAEWWFDTRPRLKWSEKRHRYSVGAEFFWHKLDDEGKQAFYIDFLVFQMEPKNNHIMCFIFLQLDEERQNEVLKKYHGRILICLLHWTKHTLFLEFLKRSWDFISYGVFLLLLEIILKKARKGIEGFAGLFEAFWNQSPDDCKNYIYQNFFEVSIEDLCALENKRLILSILDSFVGEEKENIFQSRAIMVCEMLVFINCLDLFKVFLARRLPSFESVVKFKNVFEAAVTLPTDFVFSSELPCSEFEQLQKALLILDSISNEYIK